MDAWSRITITMIIMNITKVLSYMEDHLKNKQRLEQEWVGLCAYEAEPNSTAIAFKVVSLWIVMMAMAMMMMKLIMMVMVVMVVVVMGDVCDEWWWWRSEHDNDLGGEQEEEPLPGQVAIRPQPRSPQRSL